MPLETTPNNPFSPGRGERKSPGVPPGHDPDGNETGDGASLVPGYFPVPLRGGSAAPYVNVTDGVPVADGNAAAFRSAGGVKPLGLASADFDDDGMPDVVAAYGTGDAGFLTIHRGNVDALFPNSPEAQRRRTEGTFTAEPLLPTDVSVSLPSAPDFIGAGDFDADGRQDVVTASRGGTTLVRVSGNGRGGFLAVETMALPGRVAALAVGEMNRADGLPDLLVAVEASDGPKLLVFESMIGALKSKPEAISLPGKPTALVVGQLDDGPEFDAVITCGRELVGIGGRNRGISGTAGGPVHLTRRTLSFNAISPAVGDFVGDQRQDVAVLGADGLVRLFNGGANERPTVSTHAPSREELEAEAETVHERFRMKPAPWRLEEWKETTLSESPTPGATRLVKTKTSSLGYADLIVAGTDSRLDILTASPETTSEPARMVRTRLASLATSAPPVAVLPMRLNSDALSDLVVLNEGETTLNRILTVPAATFTVVNTGDNGGVNPTPGAGTGTLRQAVVDANATPGADSISFAIPGTGVHTITLSAELPFLSSPVTLDATTQPGFAGLPLIELNGNALPIQGIPIFVNSNVVRGFVINRCRNGIRFLAGGNFVEGNFIGTDAAGIAALPNDTDGIINSGTSGNTIGGTTSAARNVISGNAVVGVRMVGTTASLNTVQGNFLGTNRFGTSGLNASLDQILDGGMNNTYGGTTATARNLVTGASQFGIAVTGVNAIIKGNSIGTDATGTLMLGSAHGVFVFMSRMNQIGGFGAGDGNIIAFNNGIGVWISSATATDTDATQNLIAGNRIYANTGLGIKLFINGGSTTVATPNDAGDPDLGANLRQNFPVLTSITPTTINGSIDSATTNSAYPMTIEFFANSTCDPLGHGEGETSLGKMFIGGPSPFAFPYTPVPGKEFITATATDNNGNTSEFCACASINTAPTITPVGVTRAQGVSASSTIANVTDPDQALNTLSVTVDGGASATVNGVTVSGISVNAAGVVSATVAATCSATTANFTLTVTDSFPASNSGTLTVTVTPNPTAASAGADQTLCVTSPAILAANLPTAGSGQWSVLSGPNTNPSQFSNAASPTAMFTPAGGGGAYTLRWTISNAPCPASTDDVVLTYRATPTPSNAGPDQTICSTGTATLAANTPTVGSGTWSVVSGPNTSAAQFSNTAAPNSQFTPTTFGTYTLRWTISNPPCAALTNDVVITVTQGPSTAAAGPDQTLCLTTPATLAANNPTVGTGVWSVAGGPSTNGSQFSNPNANNSTFTPSGGAGTYTLRWTTSNPPCPNSTDDVVLTYRATPTPSNAGADQTICSTGTATLAANTPTAGTGQWAVQSGPNTSAAQFSNTAAPNSQFTPTTFGTYTLRWTISNAPCPNSTDDVVIQVAQPPTTANAGPGQTLCVTSPAALAANTPTIGTGQWSVLNGPSLNGSQFSNVNSPTSTFTPAGGAGLYTLRWTISNPPCAPSFGTVLVLFVPSPSTADAGADQSICGLTSATLAANAPTVGSGTWSVAGGPSLNGSQFSDVNSPTATFTPAAGAGVYTLRWTISNSPCAPSTDDMTVTVLESCVELRAVYVADTQNHRVQKFDGTSWTVICGNGVPGFAANRCNLPEAVAASFDGQKIYVADTGNNRVTFSTDAGATWNILVSGPGIAPNQVNAPQGLALDLAGNLYVADTGNRRVVRFDLGVPTDAVVLATNGLGGGQVNSPRGLAVDATGTLYVADRQANKVIKIANAATVALADTGQTLAGGPGLNPGQVNGPEGVAVDNVGNLYVADTDNNRIQMFPSGGGAPTIVTNGTGIPLGNVTRPEGVTVALLNGMSMLVVGDTGGNRIQGRPLAGGGWQLIGAPNGFGSFVGQFRNLSKIR